MSHLLAISVGPVQEFIAAARRTRDLWFGSYLLSEISRAVAKSVEAQGGTLIFPAKADSENVANVILAELSAGDPNAIAANAKRAAQKRWRDFADEALREASDEVRRDIWDDQVNDVIEFYATWGSSTTDYPADRARVMRLLAGRKNCRDFLPANGRAGVPKSSLDGQRETVLKKGGCKEEPSALRLSDGEQLDVIGVTKRLGKRPGAAQPRYPSVARVAAETWLQGIKDHRLFNDLREICGRVRGLNQVAEIKYKDFPFEGTVIYKDRHSDMITELGEQVRIPLHEVAGLLEDIGGEPNPYLAVLIADGDKMGTVISALDSADAHRAFSQDLAGFCAKARECVNEHHGVLIYAGGDDVLAFLPVDRCLECARKLHDSFGTQLARYGKPTLSVGIAIGHFMENLEDLLEYGRAAENAAKKPDRDGLAMHLHKRGGAPIRMRAEWSDKPDERLDKLARLMNQGTIPTKLPYELRAMSNLYEPWLIGADEVIKLDLIRLISKKQSRGTETVRVALDGYLNDMNAEKLLIFAKELLVARQIATALRQSAMRPRPAEEIVS